MVLGRSVFQAHTVEYFEDHLQQLGDISPHMVQFLAPVEESHHCVKVLLLVLVKQEANWRFALYHVVSEHFDC